MKKRGWIEVTQSRLGGYDVLDWSEHEDSLSIILEGQPLGAALHCALTHQRANPARKLRIFGEEEDASE